MKDGVGEAGDPTSAIYVLFGNAPTDMIPHQLDEALPGEPSSATSSALMVSTAEGVGFEPTGLITRQFSRLLHSAALSPFQG